MSDRGPCGYCGIEYGIGDSPFCSHGHGRPLHGLKQIGDEIDEVLDILADGDEPVRFRSRQERKRYLNEHNLQEFVRHVGEPGSDKSSKTTRWV